MTIESESVRRDKSKDLLVSVIIPVYQVSDYVELHHLTKGRERQELTRYMAGFCNCYLKYMKIIPAYHDLYVLYRRQAY